MKPVVGDKIPEWVLTEVSAEKMKTMAALLADPNPIHFDLDVLRELGMGDRPINQGPTNVGYIMNMLAAWAGDMARIRGMKVRFLGNVLGGDRVSARGEVSSVDDTGSRCVCTVELVATAAGTAEERVVMSGTATVNIVGSQE